MAIGKRRKGRQQELFVAASEISRRGNPFYRAGQAAEEHVRRSAASSMRRRGPAEHSPGVYFRMLMVGYLRLGARDCVAALDFGVSSYGKNPPEIPGEDAEAAERGGARAPGAGSRQDTA